MKLLRPFRSRAAGLWRALWPALVVVAAAVTCDSPTSLGRGASFAITPIFGNVSLSGFSGLTVDSVRLKVIRLPSTIVAQQTLAFSADSSEIDAQISVQLASSHEDLVVLLEFLAGSQVLFTGADTVGVTAGTTTPTAATIPVSYIGPGTSIASIHITPRDSGTSFGASVPFVVSALDSSSGTVSQFYVKWSTSPSTDTINAAGLFHAGTTRGWAWVYAKTPTDIRDSTRILVAPVPSAIQKVLGDGSATVGTLQQLVVRVVAADNLPVTGVPVQFAVASGGGSVTPTGVTDTLGLASATATLGSVVGTQTFTASVTGLTSVTFSVTATSGVLATITVTPNPAPLLAGGTQQFTAVGKDAAGNIVAITPTWSVVAGGGTINSAGLFTAGAVVGTFSNTVQATSGAISGTATVTVAIGPAIALSPTAITFNGTAFGSNPAAQTVSVTNGGGGTLSGLSVGTVTYGTGASGWLAASLSTTTAPSTLTLTPSITGLAAGTYTATVPVASGVASNSPQTVAVTFVVAAPPLTTIAVAPGFSVLLTGGTVTLSVTGKDAGGATATVTGLAFVSRSPAVATVNAATGQVTGVAGGTAIVVASAAGATGTVFDSMTVAVAGTGAAVASAIGDARAFDIVKPGDTVRVLVQVDLRRIAPDKLGSYLDTLRWNTTALTYVRTDVLAPSFGPAINEGATASGQLIFGGADPNGVAGPSVTLVRVVFVGNAVGTSTLTLKVADLSGVSPLFTTYATAALIYAGAVRVQ